MTEANRRENARNEAALGDDYDARHRFTPERAREEVDAARRVVAASAALLTAGGWLG